jgi:hypothetical protein
MGTVIHDRSQEDRILELLREQTGDGWVSALELAAISLQYCRAVRGLRKRGLSIENRIEQVGRVRHGYYRLARTITQPSLIPDMVVQRWVDPEETQRI